MLLSGVWFETILAVFVAWWIWNRKITIVDAVGDGKKLKKANKIPGPFALPIFGTRWIYSWFGYYRLNKVHEAYKDLNRRYGPLCKEEALWNYLVISVFSRSDIEAILKQSPEYPLRPPQEVISYYRQIRLDRYTNLGLVNESGKTWENLRALTSKLRDNSTLESFVPALKRVTNEFIELIRTRRKDFTVTGFEELAYKMGLESTCTLILGRQLGFLNPDSNDTRTMRLAEAVRVHFTASRDAFYGLPLWKWFPTSAYRQLIKSEDTIYDIISELIEEETIEERRNNARYQPELAIFKSVLNNPDVDIRDKKAAIVDFIAAGIHTLGNTLVFLFYMIGRNPNAQENLYQRMQSLGPPGYDITVQDLRYAKYLHACIQESFRIMPTTPCIARIFEKPIEVGGYSIDPGTVILLQTWIAGMNEENFKNASTYQPERWLTPSSMDPHSDKLFVPFGSGRRVCPGKSFVHLALKVILAQIVREFEIVADEELDVQFEFILAPKSPVSLRFKDRVPRE